jgi:hypothetical protein
LRERARALQGAPRFGIVATRPDRRHDGRERIEDDHHAEQDEPAGDAAQPGVEAHEDRADRRRGLARREHRRLCPAARAPHALLLGQRCEAGQRAHELAHDQRIVLEMVGAAQAVAADADADRPPDGVMPEGVAADADGEPPEQHKGDTQPRGPAYVRREVEQRRAERQPSELDRGAHGHRHPQPERRVRALRPRRRRRSNLTICARPLPYEPLLASSKRYHCARIPCLQASQVISSAS